MAAMFEYLEKDDINFMLYDGELNKDTVEKITIQASEFAAKSGCLKFLFDMRNAFIRESIEGIYDVGTRVKDYGVNSFRIAIVVSEDVTRHLFFGTVVKNRGLQNISYFTNMKEAEQWLKEK